MELDWKNLGFHFKIDIYDINIRLMISHDTVQRIGRFIDMPYTNFNGRINIPENVDEITSILSGECIRW